MGVHSRLLQRPPSNQDPLMTRSALRSRTSPGRLVPSVWGITLLTLLFGGATLLSTSPALAKKKKAEPTQATDEASPEDKPKNEKPSDQVGDTEKPKTILDTSQEAPKTDSLGHVHFASPNAEGLGRVAVKADPVSKIKIFLEGRYFGTAAHHLQRSQGRLHRRGRVLERQAGVAPGQRRRERGDGGRPGRRGGAEGGQRPGHVRHRDDG